jgi:putative methionine-R-sulfoxide reductase with GAF domain
MISLRSCQGEELGKEHPSLVEVAIDVVSDSFGPAKNVADRRKHAHEDNSARRVFENTAEALFSVVEMQNHVEKQASDLKSAMDLVAGRTQELIGCSGIAVGLLQQNTLVYPVRLGSAATMATLPSQMSHFDFRVRQGTVLSLPDVQQDPVASIVCYPEGVRSLIILPIFHNHAVTGTMELLFAETRYFSTGDVMTLELITDIVSARVARAAQLKPAQTEGRKSHIPPRITECTEPQGDPVVPGQSRLSFSQYVDSDAAPGASGNLESSIPDTMALLAAAPVPRKRVWTKLP